MQLTLKASENKEKTGSLFPTKQNGFFDGL